MMYYREPSKQKLQSNYTKRHPVDWESSVKIEVVLPDGENITRITHQSAWQIANEPLYVRVTWVRCAKPEEIVRSSISWLRKFRILTPLQVKPYILVSTMQQIRTSHIIRRVRYDKTVGIIWKWKSWFHF